MYALLLAATAGLIFFTYIAPAAAEEQTLRFKLVTQQVGVPSALPEVGGHKVSVGQYMGVATFEDGRIAHKRFVNIDDDTAEAGSFKGYSTYTFEDGDSLTLSYTGGWNASGATGKYQVISGTGKFAGATGTGSLKAEDEPWDEAMLFDVTLNLTLATH
jgi:hypothetical protein